MEEQSFVQWMRQNSQIFVGDEYKLRLGIYTANSRFVKEHNKAGNSWTVALNKFACLTPLEYKCRFNYMSDDVKEEEAPTDPVPNYPSSLDWRKSGVCNPVKDQGSCGAGWAFASIQAVESAWAIKTGKLYSLSESNLLDCADSCKGCDGCTIETAYQFVKRKQNGLFQLEDKYPYSGAVGQCRFNSAEAPEVKIKGIYYSFRYSEILLKNNIAQHGPACCSVDASLASFQLYNSGIYDDPKCGVTNHYIGCVGYGSEGDIQYWILRNSWGSNWGEDGYMRLRIYKNRCGITNYPLLPKV